MSKVRFEPLPVKDACRNCQELGFVSIFSSLAEKENHGKRHLLLDCDIATDSPPPELFTDMLDNCFPCMETEPQEEKPLLDECLLCGFQCLQSGSWEQHWSHVALQHLETPDIFTCSQCNNGWDTPKPFGEHLWLQHPGEDANLLDHRDQRSCNVFQMCFDLKAQRLVQAGLAQFQTPAVHMAPPKAYEPLPTSAPKVQDNTQQNPLQPAAIAHNKIICHCHLCDHEFTVSLKSRARDCWKHVAACHLDSPNIFACSVCHKGWSSQSICFKRHVRVNHPGKGGRLEDKRTSKDRDSYVLCFGQTRRPCPPPRPPKRGRKSQFKRTCGLCNYRVPHCQYKCQEYVIRWEHVSKKHADGRPLFYCPLCKKGGAQVGSVTYFCRKYHPLQKAVVDNRKDLSELHQRCFRLASASQTASVQ